MSDKNYLCEDGSCRNNSCSVIVHLVAQQHSREAVSIVESALREAEVRGEICHKRVNLKWNDDVNEIVRHLSPNAVIADAEMRKRLTDDLNREWNLFDVDWLFGCPDNSLKTFVEKSGGSYGFFNDQGQIRLGGFGGAGHFNWTDIEKLQEGIIKTFGSEENIGGVFRGARVGWVGLAYKVIKWLAISGAGILVEKGFEYAYEKLIEEKGEGDKGGKGEGDKGGKGEGDKGGKGEGDKGGKGGAGEEVDVTGPDALLFLLDAYEETRLDEVWQDIINGRLPPEKTDICEEFLNWIVKQGLEDINRESWEKIKDRVPLQDEDDTGCAILYWIWTNEDITVDTESKFMKYLWNKGGPVDPMIHLGNAQIQKLEGVFDPKSGKLSLRFHP